MKNTINKNIVHREIIGNKLKDLLVIDLSDGNQITIGMDDAYKLYLVLQQKFGKVETH